jgi:hypothetical protein
MHADQIGMTLEELKNEAQKKRREQPPMPRAVQTSNLKRGDLDAAAHELRRAFTEALVTVLIDIKRKDPELDDERAADLALQMTSGPIMEKYGLSKQEMAEVAKRAFGKFA